MDGEAAYSIWRTRRSASDRDLEEEWMSSGLIARMPPDGTRHSTGIIWAASSWTCSSSNTPNGVGGRKHSQWTVQRGRVVKTDS
jgi:hypothetical protein